MVLLLLKALPNHICYFNAPEYSMSGLSYIFSQARQVIKMQYQQFMLKFRIIFNRFIDRKLMTNRKLKHLFKNTHISVPS